MVLIFQYFTGKFIGELTIFHAQRRFHQDFSVY